MKKLFLKYEAQIYITVSLLCFVCIVITLDLLGVINLIS